MPTDSQILANRENAQKSTGPTSPEGKQKVSHNAFQHGLNATTEVLFSHNPPLALDYNNHRAKLLSNFTDLEAAEEPLFDRWAFASFQAARAQTYEALAEAAMQADFGNEALERRWMRFTQTRIRLAREADAAFKSFVALHASLSAAQSRQTTAQSEQQQPEPPPEYPEGQEPWRVPRVPGGMPERDRLALENARRQGYLEGRSRRR
jgi:hypothetical protein